MAASAFGDVRKRDVIELYNHTECSCFLAAYDIMEEMSKYNPARISASMIPGVVYEAGRREGIQTERARRRGECVPADPEELHKEIAAIQNFVFAETSRERILKDVAEIREASIAGGYIGDPIFTLFDDLFVFIRNELNLSAVI